eukprot:5195419-Pleurochrysis_carterae.AAC.1
MHARARDQLAALRVCLSFRCDDGREPGPGRILAASKGEKVSNPFLGLRQNVRGWRCFARGRLLAKAL